MKTVVRANKRVDLRRNDTVRVITGRDKGKEGRVLRIFPNDAKILVEHGRESSAPGGDNSVVSRQSISPQQKTES